MEYIGFAERGLPTGAIAGMAKGGHLPRIVIGTRSDLAASFATGVNSAAPR